MRNNKQNNTKVSKMQLNEAEMTNLIKKTVKNVIREAFENDNLRKLASEHGGVDKNKTSFLAGGRNDGNMFPYDKAKVVKFIPRECYEAFMRYFFPYFKLRAPYNSVIVFKDTSAAVLEASWQEVRQGKNKDMLRNKNFMLDYTLGSKDKASYRTFDKISDNDEYLSKDIFTSGRGKKHKEANPEHNDSRL